MKQALGIYFFWNFKSRCSWRLHKIS